MLLHQPLAVLLILSVVAWDDVEGRANPYGYSDPYIDDVNEDHPWGGEDEVSEDLPSLVMPGVPGQGLSLVRPNIDIIWNFFIKLYNVIINVSSIYE